MKTKCLTLVILALVCITAISSYTPASAGVRDGCDTLNIRQNDYNYVSGYNPTAYFRAGDTIRINAKWPPGIVPLNHILRIVLRIDNVAVAVNTVPGALMYVFTQDTFATVYWYNSGKVMLDWDIVCTNS